MDYHWMLNLHDKDGDKIENGVFVFIGENTILKFADTVELEQFANRILHSLKEIRETK